MNDAALNISAIVLAVVSVLIIGYSIVAMFRRAAAELREGDKVPMTDERRAMLIEHDRQRDCL